jgi:hypothetical protein
LRPIRCRFELLRFPPRSHPGGCTLRSNQRKVREKCLMYLARTENYFLSAANQLPSTTATLLLVGSKPKSELGPWNPGISTFLSFQYQKGGTIVCSKCHGHTRTYSFNVNTT